LSVRIRNIYYLLCYAWNHVEARNLIDGSVDTGDRIENLIAHVMARGVTRLLAQGLDHGYVEHVEDIAGVRGKLLLTQSIRTLQLPRARTTCAVDELTTDVPHNRIIKATLRELVAMPSLEDELRAPLRRLLQRFAAVSDIVLNATAFRDVHLSRNLARYGFLLHLCALLCRSLAPDPLTGKRRFHPFDADEREMGAVFESFVYNFMRLEQRDYAVNRRNFDWDATAEREADLRFLPLMRTDVMLTSAGRRIVIETKFYAKPLRYRHGTSTPKLISGHLYQLLAYLERIGVEPGAACDGVLLYAGVGQPLDLEYRIAGYRVRIRTIELEQPWWQIRRDLLRIAEIASTPASVVGGSV
jgi:5-methylcytosine-specific restriction enzyme subunit McrC